MRALDLDFRNAHPWRERSGQVALVLVCGLLGLLGWHERAVLEATDDQRMTLDALTDRLQPTADSRRHEDPHVLAEVRSARKVLVRLDVPWERLFGAVESATNKDVALLGIDPDPGKGTVRITGEARHYDDVLDYERRLEGNGPLAGVYLQNHQVQVRDPERPVQFTLGAVWGGGS